MIRHLPQPNPTDDPQTIADETYPLAGAEVSGLQVGTDVANTDSIAASLIDYKVLPGIREVPFAAFEDLRPSYSATEQRRAEALAQKIRASGLINPLIVVVDAEGPYILEGSHRFDALLLLGAETLPALVVLDHATRNPADTTDPFELAKDRFGVTDDPIAGFYLLPDGEMIDSLAGRLRRFYHHNEIDYGRGGTAGMQEFMSIGAIRLLPEVPAMEIMVRPTPAQMETIREWVDFFVGRVIVDLEDGLGEYDERDNRYRVVDRRESKDFREGTRPARVLGFIRRFFTPP